MHFRSLEGMRPFAWAWKEIAHVMTSWLARWTLEEEVQMPNVVFFFLGGEGGQDIKLQRGSSPPWSTITY